MTFVPLPDRTQISFIHLQTPDIQRSLMFYQKLLGFRIVNREGSSVSLSADGERQTLISLTERPHAIPRPPRSTGLYHVAILFPNRAELARMFKRLYEAQWPFQGFADHGVSEALYLADADGNGIELYADRPRDQWPHRNAGLAMTTEELDLEDLLSELSDETADRGGIHHDTMIGHIHLMVSDLSKAERFYHEIIGFDVTQRSFTGALFVSAGGYHHHIGLNVWGSRGAPPAPKNAIGMLRFGVQLPDGNAVADLRRRLEQAGSAVKETGTFLREGTSFVTSDVDEIEVEFSSPYHI